MSTPDVDGSLRREHPTEWVRFGFGAAAVVLAIWLATLFFGTEELRYDAVYDVPVGKPQLVVECASVFHVGTGRSFEIVDGFLPSESGVVARINSDCDRQRTAAVGYMVLLAVPTAIVSAVSMLWRPARS